MEGVVVRLVGGGKVFFVRFMVNGWGWLVFGWGFSGEERGWMIVDVLLGLLCCKTNDRMSVFLLPAVVHAKRKRKKGYGGLRLVEWRRRIFYTRRHFMDCVGEMENNEASEYARLL